MTDSADDSEQPKRTMRERLEAHGIEVRESSGDGVVIPGDAIDIALADTLAGRHWLHPAIRVRIAGKEQ